MTGETTTRIAAVVGGASRRWDGTERLLLIVPSLAEGALATARVGFRAGPRQVVAELAIEASQPRAARACERLAFWCARERGWARPLDSMDAADAERFGEALARCDVSLRELDAQRWHVALARMFAGVRPSPPRPVPSRPELRLLVGGPAWEGFTFDGHRDLLFVPSPLAPPTGDEMDLSLRAAAAPERSCGARAVVVSSRRTAGASPGAPAGFTLALLGASSDARALLAGHHRPGGPDDTRAAPRYRVVCGARLDAGESPARRGEDEPPLVHVTNLSHRGAFVRTARSRSLGERIDLRLRLPGARDLHLPATVVHRGEGGVGLQFAADPEAEAVLSAALAPVPGRARRVLVVDDDALVRRILVDAFEERGWEAITAPDGEAGLRAITDELLTLDAVVTDVRMPGLSGDALVSAVRVAGGEADLVLVVVSATVDDGLARRLEAAGADRVVRKDAGPAAVVAEVEAAVRRRSVPAPALPGKDAASPPHAAGEARHAQAR